MAQRSRPAAPPEIVALTGLTDEMVKGQRIDIGAASALLGASNLVVAHNAKFDRAFCEKVLPAARDAAWACSLAEVPWTEAGFANRSLHCLACSYGVYAHDRHRALADCEVGLWLLASALPRHAKGSRMDRFEQGESEVFSRPRAGPHGLCDLPGPDRSPAPRRQNRSRASAPAFWRSSRGTTATPSGPSTRFNSRRRSMSCTPSGRRPNGGSPRRNRNSTWFGTD